MFGRATIRLGIGPHSSFLCCLCDRLDFCPAVFYTVCAACHLKVVVVNLTSSDVS